MNETSPESNPSVPPSTPPTEAPAHPENSELAAATAQAAQNFDRLVRLTADFENFKKRAGREREEVRRTTTESLIGRFIPVLDNFEMAMIAADQPNISVETLKTGVTMILQQLRGAFSEAGLEEVNAQGLMFDPALHEAVSQQPRTDVAEGTVVQQLRKGYRLRDRLLRPASVVVARKPEAESTSGIEG